MLIAITRQVSPAIAACQLTHLPRVEINYDLAVQQHRRYEQALAAAGCEIITLAADASLPDSVFIEDTAVVLDEIAVLTRPGAASREPEVAAVASTLASYRRTCAIQPPGTLEGGDVLRLGRTIYVGLSSRSNRSGIDQLAALTVKHGYTVKAVAVGACLHLKSAVTQVAPQTLLINPQWVDKSCFDGCEFIHVDAGEPYAANALRVGETVIYPASFPATLELLTGKGIGVVTVDVSELQRAEGAVTCCSLVF